MTTCTCARHADGSRTWAGGCPDHGRAAITARLLPVGTRIRSVRHPALTGYIRDLEWTRPGLISPIPYLIGWDDCDRARDALGWFPMYATAESVERETGGER